MAKALGSKQLGTHSNLLYASRGCEDWEPKGHNDCLTCPFPKCRLEVHPIIFARWVTLLNGGTKLVVWDATFC